MVSSVSAQYVTVKKQGDTVQEEGYNNYFTNYDPKRIIVEKSDHTPFTRADYDALENAPHVGKVIREDMMYDSQAWIENDKFSFYGYMQSISNLDRDPDLGGMPQSDNEVILAGYDDGWTFGESPEALIGQTYTVTADSGAGHKVKIAGIILVDPDEQGTAYSDPGAIYLPESTLSLIRSEMYAAGSTTKLLINGSEETLYPGTGGLVVNDKVPEGYILLPTSYDSLFREGYAAGKIVSLSTETLYYKENLSLMIMGTYGEKTFTKKTGLKNLAEHDGEIYISGIDYRRLYEKGSYQASVFVDDTKNMEGMKDMLERGGYHTLVLKDHISQFMNEDLVRIIQLPVAVIICLAVFFIAYFVVRLILKSRGVYFATVRMLGMSKGPAQRIMRVELVLVCMIAYGLFCLFIYLSRSGILSIQRLTDYLTYLTGRDYMILALILLIMAVLISDRFMRSIFRSSAMGAYREEA